MTSLSDLPAAVRKAIAAAEAAYKASPTDETRTALADLYDWHDVDDWERAV